MPDDKYPGDYLFPVAYLYRHYLELQLKNIISLAETLKYITKDEKIHNLKKLWKNVRKVLSQTEAVDIVEINGVEAIVLDIHRVDKSGQEFRYPAALNGSDNLSRAPEKISLVNIRDVMNKVYDVLNDVYNDLVGEFDGHIPSRKK
jgi:hypothetical protein